MGTKTEKQMNRAGGTIQQKCPVCYHPKMTVFFEVKSAPVFCNVLWNNRNQAIAAPRAAIHLAYCQECGLIYNTAFDARLMEYSPSYENSLHFSPRFQEYAEQIAHQLVQRYQLHNKDIIEIGCGQGDFLAMLQHLGNNRALGFDPSYTPEKTAADPESSAVVIFPEAYSEAYAKYPADFICCRHMLEHIDHPLDFLTNIRKTIGRQEDCVVYFEVPNALYIFKDTSVWDIIYEHCSYFTSESLTNLFGRVGFKVIEVTEQYDGQFLTIEARPMATETNSKTDFKSACSHTQSLIKKFHKTYQDKVNSWQHTLSRLKKQKSRIVLWGAGSKGVTFVNAMDISHKQIKYIVDLNPRKHGQFVAGTGQQVIAPDFLKKYRPQTVIIMNPIYRAEIQQVIQEYGLTPEFVPA